MLHLLGWMEIRSLAVDTIIILRRLDGRLGWRKCVTMGRQSVAVVLSMRGRSTFIFFFVNSQGVGDNTA